MWENSKTVLGLHWVFFEIRFLLKISAINDDGISDLERVHQLLEILFKTLRSHIIKCYFTQKILGTKASSKDITANDGNSWNL